MKYIVGILLVSVSVLGFQQHSQRLDMSGLWKLDMKRSDNLPKSFEKVESFVMNIEQSKDSMVISRTMVGAGQTQTFPPTMYKFDGTEVYYNDTLRGSERWTKAMWATTEQKLIVTSRVIQRAGPKEVRYTETDVWQKGKRNMLLILVTQKYEGNDSTRTERRYYRHVQ
ncbi:MAG: hypothetical protein HY033_04255 [Ignavibacteriae bacterium]|nr:hypothetical protein [Ignavibacteria bacterium]MBI3364100.1 hypothetical protein [Ignavibacteriota bacterium]